MWAAGDEELQLNVVFITIECGIDLIQNILNSEAKWTDKQAS